MRRPWILALALCAGLAGPAAAQWTYDEGPGTARAYVTAPDGTSFGLRCTSAEVDRQTVLVDLLVYPTATANGDEDVVEFEIGPWTFNLETVRIEQSGALVRYQSRLSYYDSVSENLRREVKSGAALRFTRAFDFALSRFTLSGSRASVERLERACARLWSAGLQPALRAAPPPMPAAPRVSGAPPAASGIPEPALLGLRDYVASVIAPHCAGGTSPSLPAGMFEVAGDRVTVHLRMAQCVWAHRINPYCGARLCQTWVYGWTGESFSLLETSLR
jgi:hypothetical protein